MKRKIGKIEEEGRLIKKRVDIDDREGFMVKKIKEIGI